MRLGAPVFEKWQGPDGWAAAVKRRGYGAAYCPVEPGADEADVGAFRDAARAADICIAEVGAWSNPISPAERVRQASLTKCRRALELADRIGARCCVNVAGSRFPQDGDGPMPQGWAAPHPDNLTEDTFDLIVRTVRDIIDAVKPTRTFYTLEAMPWIFPDSVDSYVRLIRAIDRERFAAHLDPANLICSPQVFFKNGDLIRECFRKLGPHIRSCHAKDVSLMRKAMVHLDEVRPGAGGLDYEAFLREASRLDPDLPIMLEHLPDEREYAKAADYVRGVAAGVGVSFL